MVMCPSKPIAGMIEGLMAVAVIGGTTAHRPGTTTGSTPATETLSLYSPSGQPGMRARTNPFDAAAHTL